MAGKGNRPIIGVNWNKFRDNFADIDFDKKKKEGFMRKTSTHLFFYGSGAIYSNWHSDPKNPRQFLRNNNWFANTEQAFMYEKAILFNDHETAQEILATPSPKDVKALGRKVRNFDAQKWEDRALGIMTSVNLDKYSQNPEFKKELLETGERILVEASPYDKIWGVGLHYMDAKILDEKNWLGKNLLGKALMNVRRLLSAS